MIIPTHEQVLQNRRAAKLLEERINKLLSAHSDYSSIISLLSEKESMNLAIHDPRIYILYITAQIVRLELQNNSTHVLYEGRNTEQLIRLYQILSLYLRRIEFDFPDNLTLVINDFIINEQISFIAVLSVIQNNTSIIHKEKVSKKVLSIMSGVI